ncbi:MAG: sugar phosphate isomerase/epimerase [Clostridia bacterium]|nr:sugar phosphate isomerase/epimerase [Clostridia bacterium]
MKKGITLFFGFNSPVEERIKRIKAKGFDCVITSADPRFNHQNGNIKKQVKLLTKHGLELSSLHMRYLKDELPYFWLEGKRGEKIKKDLIKDVKIAKKYGFTCVVVHCRGQYSKVGEQRLREVLKVCEKYDMPLAIENLLSSAIFNDVFQNIQHPYLKFCYDSGHDNCDKCDFDYFKLYGDKLITLHLHDNDGTSDQHTLNCVGSIDWKRVAKNIKKYNPTINLDYEIIYLKNAQHFTEEEVLDEVKKQADELEKMIEKASRKK